MRKETYRIRRHRERWLRDEHDRAARRRDYAYLAYEESIRAHARIEAGADIRVVWPRLERSLTRLLRNAGNASMTPAEAAQWAARKPLSLARESLSWNIFGWSDRWNQDRLLRARALYRRATGRLRRHLRPAVGQARRASTRHPVTCRRSHASYHDGH